MAAPEQRLVGQVTLTLGPDVAEIFAAQPRDVEILEIVIQITGAFANFVTILRNRMAMTPAWFLGTQGASANDGSGVLSDPGFILQAGGNISIQQNSASIGTTYNFQIRYRVPDPCDTIPSADTALRPTLLTVS